MKKIFILTLVVGFFISCNETSQSVQEDFTKYIDPTIGNVSRFLVPTFPTIHLPNQMMRMYPAKKQHGYISDQIDAFPLFIPKHRGRGMFNMKLIAGAVDSNSWQKQMNFDHDLEIIKPWHYSTYLIDDDIKVGFVPGKKVAMYELDFGTITTKSLLFKGTGGLNCKLEGDVFLFSDEIRYKDRGIFEKLSVVPTYLYAQITNSGGEVISDVDLLVHDGKYEIKLPQNASGKIYLRYAVSFISFEQAKMNYEMELANVQFNDLADSGKKAWQKVTNQIEVKGGTETQKRSFYTSLYRTYERMVDVSEYGKYYSGYDGKVHESDRPFFVDDWIWDTYLATHPLRTIIAPELENNMLNSYTEMFEQSGWMPTFPQVHGNHMCMNSFHSSAIFIDGYRKGLRDYDVEKAYQGIRKNLTEGTFIPWRQGTPRRPIDDFYHENGYFPSLKIGEEETEPQMDGFEKRQPVAVTLGISYDFWAMTELAKEIGADEDYKKYAPKAKDYTNLWDPNHRLFMPKDADGNWVDINPKSSGGPGFREYYDENNGWTYAWDVQHDIAGLTTLLGGKKAAEERLDQLFREPLGMKKRDFTAHGSNSTGMVGQFSMGNEPSFHIPYLYNYFGAPWKTQKRTRFLLDVWFKDNIFGIPGDEDGGGMTAFVVFSSMGIYPVTPGIPVYTITSPVFEEVSIKLKNGNIFKVIAKGASKQTKYIQKAFINGNEIDSPFITHEQIMNGATIELVLGDLPNKQWGKDAKMPKY